MLIEGSQCKIEFLVVQVPAHLNFPVFIGPEPMVCHVEDMGVGYQMPVFGLVGKGIEHVEVFVELFGIKIIEGGHLALFTVAYAECGFELLPISV